MRILLINSMCGTGSTGRIVADLYNRITANGDVAKIAYGLEKATGVPIEDTYKINNKVGYYIHNILAKLTDRTGLYSTIKTKQFVNWIKKYDPDVIHLHNLHGYYINYEILFNYIIKNNIKVLWTLHDCWSFTGHCAHFDMIGCRKWLSECSECKHKNLYPKSYFISNSHRNYVRKKSLIDNINDMTIICPSGWIANLAKQSFLGGHSILVINNGIDLSKFYPDKCDFREKYGLEKKRILLGVASNWNHAKGFDDFISLSNLIDQETVIVLVGVSSKQIDVLSKNIIGIKKTQSIDELRMIYSEADVFLNLTYEDTFPTVNMEALACGTPVLTYDTGGSSEIVDISCGRTVQAGDLASVLDKIHECYTLKSEDCVKRAKLFDKGIKYDEYYTIYNT